ncbi:bifunctional diguanylate cyclase/phosphodiesterase [Soehngenia longivitae]|uniref:Bifunctional diguanylate cyclase/phosphodiesterase n=1 Tax=Soehngenia longivitae TaxID=2562294 RepID=A0A4Z0D5V8_9FIRM|nr:EAL domain-containing protein [Soehngenia longivitae]TFZ40256.1 bifunctional diguanylate cyclase/phosphodiesterase [Soehngenia longivitae]
MPNFNFDENNINLIEKLDPKKKSLKLAMIYLTIGITWIFSSDKIASLLTNNPKTLYLISLYKGWVYMLVTAIIFYFILKRQFDMYKDAIVKVKGAHDDISNLKQKLEMVKSEYKIYEEKLKEVEQKFELSIKGSNYGIWNWDIDKNFYFTSLLIKPQFGYSEDYQSTVNTIEKWREHIHKDDLPYALNKLDEALLDSNGIYENALRIRTVKGNYRWVVTTGKIKYNEYGKPIAIAGSHIDITEKLQLEEELKMERKLLDVILNDIPIIIIRCDSQGKIIMVNKFFKEVFKFEENEFIGESILNLIADDLNRVKANRVISDIVSGKKVKDMEIELLTKDNQKKTIIWSNSFIYNEENRVKDILFIGMDITQRKEMENQLYNLAYFDQLTGLPNKYKLEKDMVEFEKKADDENGELVFVYADIDDFNLVNEIYGHSKGDDLLINITQKISGYFPFEHFIYRFGGDEYVIVLVLKAEEKKDSIEDKIIEITRYSDTIQRLLHNEFNVSFSAGVSIYPFQAENYEELLKKADLALNHAKKFGKKRTVVYFDELDKGVKELVELEEDLKVAVKNNEFFLLYQPQIDLKTMEIIGGEALIRWNRPRHGIETPLSFIPYAEETGEILKIDSWVIKQALMEIDKLSSLGLDDFKISMNISGNTLNNLDYLRKLISELSIIYDFSKAYFEITETNLIEDLENSREALETIKKAKGRIALDDFGVGYSSLSYLKGLDIDMIKIDKSFIDSIDLNMQNKKILSMIVNLSHELGMKVLAEGVETKEQLNHIIEVGCDYAQGYYFYKPLSVEEFEKILWEQLKNNQIADSERSNINEKRR